MTLERWLKAECEMSEKRRQREQQRKEVLAILDVLEWALSRLRQILGGC